MNKSRIIGGGILAALVLISQSSITLAQEQSLEERVDTVLEAWNNTDAPGAAVAYFENGETVFSKAYGLANLEHRIPWSTDTVSDLGSVSKQFTGFAFAVLAEQGKLALDDDIRLYLQDLPDFGETITIRHLFNHTSGLREIYNTLYMVNRKPGDIIYQEDAQTLVQHQSKLQFSPGSRYLYNNTEYMLLADIVEVVTGQQFHDWLAENIFQPLEMNDTYVMYQQGQVIPRVASSYVRGSAGAFTQRYDNSTIQGAGGMYSTVEDMTKWIANFSTYKIGSAQTFAIMTESGVLNNGESLNYGLGITVGEASGNRTWSHSGSSAGYRSMLTYLPDEGRGFIYMTNTPSHGAPAQELARVFFDDLLEEEQEEQNPAARPVRESFVVEDLSRYTGRYLSDELEAFYSVEHAEGVMKLTHRWLQDYPMLYRGDESFDLVGSGGSITFDVDENDRVTGFIFDNGRTIGVEFQRIRN